MRFLLMVALLSAALPANAMNTWGTDMSDLWWNPDESGWGINVVHQRDVVFATIFVYGPDNRARWYVAPAMTAETAAVTYAFSGKLYETQGPFLGGAFNPASVTNREVGTASLNFYEVGKGTLTYGVDTSLVIKEIRRQTFRQAEIAGTYLGGTVGTGTTCTFSGGSLTGSGEFGITFSPGSNVATITTPAAAGQRCTLSGIYEQQGRMGVITGNFSCTGGLAGGRITLFEIEAGYNAISMRYDAQYINCVDSGRMAGVRR